MLLFFFPLYYRSLSAENINDNILDEPSANVEYEIPMTTSPAYHDTTQFIYKQSSENSYAYVDVQR